MAEKSTTENADSGAGADELDKILSAEDHRTDPDDSTDDQQTDKGTEGADDDDLTSEEDSADEAEADKTDDAAKTESKAPAFDADLDEWAEKTGHDKPETDRERKLLQDLRDSKRDFTRERQTKSERDLQKAIKEAAPAATDEDIIDPLEKDVKELKVQLRNAESRRLMSEYISRTPITSEEQEAMAEVLKEKAARGDTTAFNYLSDGENIADWHALGKARLASATDSNSEIASKARKEERERLAKITKSGGPNRSATNRVPAGKKDELTELWESDD